MLGLRRTTSVSAAPGLSATVFVAHCLSRPPPAGTVNGVLASVRNCANTAPVSQLSPNELCGGVVLPIVAALATPEPANSTATAPRTHSPSLRNSTLPMDESPRRMTRSPNPGSRRRLGAGPPDDRQRRVVHKPVGRQCITAGCRRDAAEVGESAARLLDDHLRRREVPERHLGSRRSRRRPRRPACTPRSRRSRGCASSVARARPAPRAPRLVPVLDPDSTAARRPASRTRETCDRRGAAARPSSTNAPGAARAPTTAAERRRRDDADRRARSPSWSASSVAQTGIPRT